MQPLLGERQQTLTLIIDIAPQTLSYKRLGLVRPAHYAIMAWTAWGNQTICLGLSPLHIMKLINGSIVGPRTCG